jgi:hypothetical protein
MEGKEISLPRDGDPGIYEVAQICRQCLALLRDDREPGLPDINDVSHKAILICDFLTEAQKP